MQTTGNGDVLETQAYNESIAECRAGINEALESIELSKKIIEEFHITIRLIKEQYFKNMH